MQNMVILENAHIQTAYGIFGGVTSYEVYDTGELRSVMLNERNVILTHAGELVPAYTENERRKYKPAVEFYRSGMIRSVYLDEQQELMTPIGEFPAELVSFYETGEMKRIFPLDGKISGFRSEEDERNLNIPISFDLGFTRFQAMLGNICFYRTGDIRSITLFPGEVIDVGTKYGRIRVRNGFSLYESGALQSCEPAVPFPLDTPIGKITAFDPDASGITADSNSLCFYEDGNLSSLITVSEKIGVQTEDECFSVYAPKMIPPLTEEAEETVSGMKIEFQDGKVRLDGREWYSCDECGFTILPFTSGSGFPVCSPSDCASCSLCRGQTAMKI